MPESLNNISVSYASFAKQAIDNRLKDLHTAMPGIIKSFNHANQTATVQPAIRRIFVTKEEEKTILTPTDLPVLIHVPVIFPKGGGFSLTFPIAVGDECLLLFCERDTAAWFKKSGIQTPTTYRMHNLSDAICIVGMSSEPSVITDFDPYNVMLRNKSRSTYIKIDTYEKISLYSPVEINIESEEEIAITSPHTTWIGDIELTGAITQTGDYTREGEMTHSGLYSITGDVTITGDLVVQGIDYLTHIHGGVQTGGGTTGVPQ